MIAARSDRLVIGMMATGGREWIAGPIYVQNLLRSILWLPPGERPKTVLLVGPGRNLDAVPSLYDDASEIAHYSFPNHAPPWKCLAGIGLSLVRGRFPGSAEVCAARCGVDVIFPIMNAANAPRAIPWIGWIPDFQFKHYPQFWTREQIATREKIFQGLVRDAPHLVVSSKFAYDDLVRWFPADARRTSVLRFVSAPVSQWYAPDPAAVTRDYGLPEKFLIFPSQFWAHKNHEILFEAVRLLRDGGIKDVCLVCTGLTRDNRNSAYFSKLMQQLKRQELTREIRILGLLPRHDQIQILRRAAAVVQPSLFEGWSALLEDCRTLGKRIFVSDIPVHREQEPPRASFFSPHDAHALADLIGVKWDRLEPGPDLEVEAAELHNFQPRAQAFARSFLDLVGRVLA